VEVRKRKKWKRTESKEGGVEEEIRRREGRRKDRK